MGRWADGVSAAATAGRSPPDIPRSTDHVEFPLQDAHGVYWDETTGLLWALGGHDLVALRLGGTPAAPTLTEVRRTALPTPGGHDLQPVADDPDRFWVTSNTEVYQYSVEQDAFLQDYRGAARISTRSVKSAGDAPDTGQVLTSYVQPGNLCTWCTSTATLENPRERFTLHGAQIYKARWWADPTA